MSKSSFYCDDVSTGSQKLYNKVTALPQSFLCFTQPIPTVVSENFIPSQNLYFFGFFSVFYFIWCCFKFQLISCKMLCISLYLAKLCKSTRTPFIAWYENLIYDFDRLKIDFVCSFILDLVFWATHFEEIIEKESLTIYAKINLFLFIFLLRSSDPFSCLFWFWYPCSAYECYFSFYLNGRSEEKRKSSNTALNRIFTSIYRERELQTWV